MRRTAKGSTRISAAPCYPAYYANRARRETPARRRVRRPRGIWGEGAFAALGNNHNLRRRRKRGVRQAAEECLLAAPALNLKRMAKAVGA
ncbi:MAG: transposase [Treponema sp.]|nr:transposase [Treponema sp.]